MGNKALNLMNNVQKHCDKNVYEGLCEIFAEVDTATAAKQGKIIKSCLETLEKTGVDTKPIMRDCNCLSEAVIKKAKAAYGQAQGDMNLFLELLNEKGIGGGQLRLEEKDLIIAVYSKCYCGVAKGVKGLSAGYCQCSAGWFQKLFSRTLEKNVTVNIIHTIISGENDCVFEIIVE